MPKLSAFPKCYMDELCVTKTMTLFEWIALAGTLGVDGVEVYPGFFESFEPKYLERAKNATRETWPGSADDVRFARFHNTWCAGPAGGN